MNAIKSLTAFTWRSRMLNASVFAFTAVALIPALITFVSLIYGHSGGEEIDLLREVVVPINVYFTLPFITIFLTLPTVSSLYEKGAIGYIFTRPISRLTCVSGLFFGSVVSALPLLFVAALAPSIVCMLISGANFSALLNIGVMHCLLLLLALLPYSALCLMLAIWSKKPLLWASFFLFFWGSIIGSLPGDAKIWSLHHYVMGLAKSMCGIERVAVGLIPPSATPPANWLSIVILLSVSISLVYLASYSSKQRDIL